MAERDPKRELEDLDARIAAFKKATGGEDKPHQEEHYSQAQIAWRMVTEMVAGLGIGFGIGYGLDTVLGTLPWFMVVFTLLGLVAGIKVMIRTAQEAQAKQLDAEALASGAMEETGRTPGQRVPEGKAANEGTKDGD